MSKLDFTLYFSGTENVMEDIFKFCDNGYRIKGVMVTYFSLRGNEKLAQQLKVFREKYRGKVMIDSGAHAFLFKDRVENKKDNTMTEGWHPVSKSATKLLSSKEDLEAYVHEYMDWLDTHRESYDYAVELDIQKLVGNEKVDEWRKEFLERGLNVLLVAHRNIREGMDFVHKWKALGCDYFGVGDFDKKDASSVAFIKKAMQEGVKLHIFAFTPNDLFKYVDWITSVDSTSWLSGEKLKALFMAQRKSLSSYRIEENPLQLKKALVDKFFDVVGRGRVEEEKSRGRYRFISFWNMWQMQKWADDNTKVPKYKKQLELAKQGKMVLPDWVYDKDKFGRPKSIYLQSRFNNYRSGVYARKLMDFALECDNCVVKDTCPVYQPQALCYFTPLFKKLGKNTRNKEQIIRTLQDVISDKMMRYQRGKLFEAQSGGVIDRQVTQLEDSLIKSLEVLHTIMYGKQPVGTQINMLNQEGSKVEITANIDEALKELAQDYGEDFMEGVKKRISKKGGDIGEDIQDKTSVNGSDNEA